jgi:hypothetical protein
MAVALSAGFLALATDARRTTLSTENTGKARTVKTKKQAKPSKLSLMDRFKLNKDKQLKRLDELDVEIDKALDRGETPILASQDPRFQALRREFDDLEREMDRRNLKRLSAQTVAIYGGEEGKTVTSIAAVAGVRPKKKSTRKAKRRFRI